MKIAQTFFKVLRRILFDALCERLRNASSFLNFLNYSTYNYNSWNFFVYTYLFVEMRQIILLKMKKSKEL